MKANSIATATSEKISYVMYLFLFAFLVLSPSLAWASLVVTPADGFEPSGQEGGDFAPSSKEYLLYNDGVATLYWGAEWNEIWINTAPEWGVLDPGESVPVLVSLTPAAELLSEGIYTDAVVFTDITHMADYTRQVLLTVTESADTGLAAWWMLDEESGATASDSSGNEHHGTLVNMDSNDWVAGKIGNCLDFDGADDYVEATGYLGIGGSQVRTCCAWIRTIESSGSILTYGSGSVLYGEWLFILNGEGRLQLGINGGNIIGTTIVSDGQWHHVAVVLEAPISGPVKVQDLRLYIDGLPELGIYTNPDAEFHTELSFPVRIGVKESGVGGVLGLFFSGQIDDVRIYNRSLSEAEIAELAGIGPLVVSPDESFDASGEPGGPFTPAYQDYTLKNLSDQSLYWGIDSLPDWLDTDRSFGSLNSGESATVRVFLTEQADLLDEGFYTDSVVFNNLSISQDPVVREVSLDIQFVGGIWTDPHLFEAELIKGTTAQENLRVGNNSAETYSFTVRTRTVQSPAAAQKEKITRDSGGDIPDQIYLDPGSDYPDGQVLVRFQTSGKKQLLKKSFQEAVLSESGQAVVERQYSLIPGLSLVQLPAGMTVEEAIQTYRPMEEVLYIQPNYRVHADSTFPNDPRFSDLWGLHNTGQSGGKLDADIDGPEAWDFIFGSDQVIVAVIDTGVDYTHEDLAPNMWINQPEWNGTPGVDDDGNGYVDDIYGYDFRNEDPNPMDDHYHGTHCAGTIGAAGNNGKGITGICWDVKIMALKFLGSSGSGTTSDAIQCIQYAVQMGANVMSNSWGGGDYSQALYDAIQAAGNANVLFVAAAGNNGSNNDTYPHYPSNYTLPNVISVMATDRNDTRSDFSNYGPTSVDLGAPGTSILSCEPGNRYQYLNGTSMACPHVSGACAALWSLNPGLSADEVKNILLSTVDPTLPGRCVSEGRLNLYNAVLETKVPWLSFDVEEGTLGPDEYADIQVTISAMALEPGFYAAEILILSDDPMRPTTVIPVDLAVLPDPLEVLPEHGFDPNGFEGGPFAPEAMTYTLRNVGSQPLEWQLEYSATWVDADVTSGILNPAESQTVHLQLGESAYQLGAGFYEDILIFRNLLLGSQQFRPAVLSVQPPDLFTESFRGDFDLSGKTIRFRPAGNIAYYACCVEADDAADFAFDPAAGTFLSLGDDDFAEVVFTGGREFLFYGVSYDRVYIGSNGYLTFGEGDWWYEGSLEDHFILPRISMLFTDLTPPNNQCISWQQLEDRFVVTFENVPIFGDKMKKSSFQAELFFADQVIRMTYLSAETDGSIIGLSRGLGLPEFFAESDLSSYLNCCSCGDLEGDGYVGMSDLSEVAVAWLRGDCMGPDWCGWADLNRDSAVDGADLSLLASHWQEDMSEYGWSESQIFPELNDGTNFALTPCLSGDGLSIYFSRDIPSLGIRCIVQATRSDPEGSFTSERILTELDTTGLGFMAPWLSSDGLRLYYHENDESGKSIIKKAEREPNDSIWASVTVLAGLPEDSFHASLTEDEMQIFFCRSTTEGSVSGSDCVMWTASRSSTGEPFANARPLDELNCSNRHYTPRIMPDGLTLYFCSNRYDPADYDIFRARRSEANFLFGPIERIDAGNNTNHIFVTRDEKAIYFVENKGAYLGIGMSRLEKKEYTWSEPQLLAELNDGANVANLPCLSSDGLSIYFARFIPSLGCSCIVEATRLVPEGLFGSERVLSELMTTGDHVRGPWISEDGFRLYYKEAQQSGPELFRMARRDSLADPWIPALRTFPELNVEETGIAELALTRDELVIFYQKVPPVGFSDIYMATRSSIEEPFSDVANVAEINTLQYEQGPYVTPDGFTIYFNSDGAEPGQHDLYKATRISTIEPFSKVQKVSASTPNKDSVPWIDSTETILYFYSEWGDKKGIWFSKKEPVTNSCLPR